MDAQDIHALRKRAQALKVTVTVGKNGITDQTVEELDRHLHKEKLVKVRLLKSATYQDGMDTQAATLAERTRSTLVETRGGTAVFHRG